MLIHCAHRSMRRLLTGLIVVVAVVCSGCGKHTHELQIYTRDLDAPDSSFEKKVGPLLIYLIVQGTVRLTNDGGVFDEWRVTEPPYTLHIGALYYGKTADTAEIRKVTLQLGNHSPTVLLGEDEPSVLLAFEPALDHAMYAGTKFALDDTLPFIDRRKAHKGTRSEPCSAAAPRNERFRHSRSCYRARRPQTCSHR